MDPCTLAHLAAHSDFAITRRCAHQEADTIVPPNRNRTVSTSTPNFALESDREDGRNVIARFLVRESVPVLRLRPTPHLPEPDRPSWHRR